ncbi:Histone-lysine N-methyltransferase ASHH3 [Glycine soja]
MKMTMLPLALSRVRSYEKFTTAVINGTLQLLKKVFGSSAYEVEFRSLAAAASDILCFNLFVKDYGFTEENMNDKGYGFQNSSICLVVNIGVASLLIEATTAIFVEVGASKATRMMTPSREGARPLLHQCFEDQIHRLYKKVSLYLHSLPSIEDTDFTNLITGKKQNDIVFCLGPNQTIKDHFLEATLFWLNQTRTFVLKIRKVNKRQILCPYFQHIHVVAKKINQQGKHDLCFFMNNAHDFGHHCHGTGSQNQDLKSLLLQSMLNSMVVIEDLERFLANKMMRTSASGILNFMDRLLISCCTEERVMVFTMNMKEHVDPNLLHSGRVIVHIDFRFMIFQRLKQMTGKRGFGIVVAKDIKVGEFVIEYVGEATYDLQVLPFWNMKQRGERNFYLCEINRDMVIDATYKGNKSRYTNHSCCPNTEMQKWIIDGETRIGIFATSDIQKDIYAFGKFWRCWSLRNYASMTGWLFYVSNYIVGLLHLVHIKIAIEVLLSAGKNIAS